MCVTRRNRIMAFARVVGTIRCDTPEVMIRRDLIEQIRQHGCIADAAACDLDGAYLQRFLINPNVDLAPQAAFWATMLTGIPFPFTLSFDACAIDQKVQRPCGALLRNGNRQRSLTAT